MRPTISTRGQKLKSKYICQVLVLISQYANMVTVPYSSPSWLLTTTGCSFHPQLNSSLHSFILGQNTDLVFSKKKHVNHWGKRMESLYFLIVLWSSFYVFLGNSYFIYVASWESKEYPGKITVLFIYLKKTLRFFLQGWYVLFVKVQSLPKCFGSARFFHLHGGYIGIILLLFFFFLSTGAWTQGLHLEPLHQPFFLWRVFFFLR
jgi:hypothetical protein